jgi:signal transduction histidine kinase
MATILVVDDRSANRELLVTVLGYQGHQVLEAEDGSEALTIVRAGRPDLVICDVLMPKMDGYEFVRQLRTDGSLAATKVVFYTAHFREREAQTLARTAGISHVLTKPCEPEDLMLVIDEALQGPPDPPLNEQAQEFTRRHLRLVADKLSEKADQLRIANQQVDALIELNLKLAAESAPVNMGSNGGSVHSVGEFAKEALRRVVTRAASVLDMTVQRRSADSSGSEQRQVSSRRLVEMQESELRQLSRELHDRIGQNLTALSINLDLMKARLSGNSDGQLRSALEDSGALLEATVDAIENVMSELRPPMLDDYGLLPALDWYAREFSKRTGIKVAVRGEEPKKRPAQEVDIALFRIAQEALNNVAKHARATQVAIGLEYWISECIMTVSDDGIGFDPEAASSEDRPRAGFGMITMRERCEAVGGHFEIRAEPERGTQITVRVPY